MPLTQNGLLRHAGAKFRESATFVSLSALLAWQDVRQAYRRSSIGAFWITGGMMIQILTIALVFGIIFKVDLNTYLPFVAVSLVFWTFLSSLVSDSTTSLVHAENMIRQLNLPVATHVIRAVWKNIFALGHNIVILPMVMIFCQVSPSWNLVLEAPGLMIFLINLTWIAFVISFLGVRYRDVSPIMGSVLTVAFYVTPVMWFPSLLENNDLAHFLLGLNPLYHLMQIVRLPILGEAPTWENWVVSSAMAIFGVVVSRFIYRKFKKKIAYWV